MEIKTNYSPVLDKLRELCQTVIDQPSFEQITAHIRAFEQDPKAREQYNTVCDLQDIMRDKEQQGVPLTDDDIDEYEREREALFNNPVAAGFIQAQQQIHRVHETVSQYVQKTFQLGRVPNDDDFQSGSCGPRCGCGG